MRGTEDASRRVPPALGWLAAWRDPALPLHSDARLNIVFVNSKTGRFGPGARARLCDHSLGCDFPLSLNEVTDVFVGTAMDILWFSWVHSYLWR